jgi:hypothetical protein
MITFIIKNIAIVKRKLTMDISDSELSDCKHVKDIYICEYCSCRMKRPLTRISEETSGVNLTAGVSGLSSVYDLQIH